MGSWGRGLRKISVPSFQVCHESKTALKKKAFKRQINNEGASEKQLLRQNSKCKKARKMVYLHLIYYIFP